MKKLFYTIFIAVQGISMNTFAQDDTYEAGTIDKNTLAASYSKDVYKRMVQTTKAAMTPKQRMMAAQSLNERNKTAKWVKTPSGEAAKITVNDLDAFMDQSEIMLGSELSGPVMAYEMDDDDIGYKTYMMTLDGPEKAKSFKRDTKFVAYGKVPYIMIRGNPYSDPEPLPVYSNMPPAPVTIKVPTPAPVVSAPPKAPDTVVAQPQGTPYIVNNIYNYSNGNASTGGIEPTVYGSTAGVGGNYYGVQSKFGYNNNCGYGNGYGYGGGVSVGVSAGIVWYLGNPYYWDNNYWYCGRNRSRVPTEVYGSLCSHFGTPGTPQYTVPVSQFGNSGGQQSTVQTTIYGGPRKR